MIRQVRVAGSVHDQAHERFGESRSDEGIPSEYDFVSGPLAAAVFAFRDFDTFSLKSAFGNCVTI